MFQQQQASTTLAAPLLQQQNSNVVLYEDGFIRITALLLIIKWYYFPLGLSKVIPLSSIKQVTLHPLGKMLHGQYKHWGMGVDCKRWWPSDCMRHTRSQFIEVDVGQWPCPAFTCHDDNITKVYPLLSQAIAQAKRGGGGGPSSSSAAVSSSSS